MGRGGEGMGGERRGGEKGRGRSHNVRDALTPLFETFNFKNAVILKTGLGVPSRSLEMSPFDGAHMTSFINLLY